MSRLPLEEKYSLRGNFPSLGLAVMASLYDEETLNGRLMVLFARRSKHLAHIWSVINRRGLITLTRNDMPPACQFQRMYMTSFQKAAIEVSS